MVNTKAVVEDLLLAPCGENLKTKTQNVFSHFIFQIFSYKFYFSNFFQKNPKN